MWVVKFNLPGENVSAEGKKKRGIAGATNAKNIPFRYGGSKCDYSNSPRSCSSKYGAGSLLVRAMMLGARLPGFSPSQRLLTLTDAAMGRCTHSDLCLDAEMPLAAE